MALACSAMTLLLSLASIIVGTTVVLIKALRVGLLLKIPSSIGLVIHRFKKSKRNGNFACRPRESSIALTGTVSLAGIVLLSRLCTA